MAHYMDKKGSLCKSVADFVATVQVIHDYREIMWLDLEPRSAGAKFFADDIGTLQQFCRDNPTYHIVTCTGPHRLVNTYVPGCRVYYLAKGDKNPLLILNFPLTSDFELLNEDVESHVSTVMNHIKNRH